VSNAKRTAQIYVFTVRLGHLLFQVVGPSAGQLPLGHWNAADLVQVWPPQQPDAPVWLPTTTAPINAARFEEIHLLGSTGPP